MPCAKSDEKRIRPDDPPDLPAPTRPIKVRRRPGIKAAMEAMEARTAARREEEAARALAARAAKEARLSRIASPPDAAGPAAVEPVAAAAPRPAYAAPLAAGRTSPAPAPAAMTALDDPMLTVKQLQKLAQQAIADKESGRWRQPW